MAKTSKNHKACAAACIAFGGYSTSYLIMWDRKSRSPYPKRVWGFGSECDEQIITYEDYQGCGNYRQIKKFAKKYKEKTKK